MIIFVMILITMVPSVPVLETMRRVEKAEKKKVVAAAFGIFAAFGISLWGALAIGVATCMMIPASSPWILMILFVTALVMAGGIALTIWFSVEIENKFNRKASAREWEQWRQARYGDDPFAS